MSLLGKSPETIDESVLQALVNTQKMESKYIEYKEQLPGNLDSERKEFLADVSSFANASGGDLIFGIRTRNGVPAEFCGLKILDSDKEISRLENIIRDGIAPRIAVHIWPVGKPASRLAILIRVRKSWAAPHMVTFKDHSKFYSRNSNGKYPLDVSEIRTAFLLSETIAEKIRSFRKERLRDIQIGQTPVTLEKNPKLVLHLIPFGAFEPGIKFDLSLLASEIQSLRSPFLELNSPWGRYNFDGYLVSHQLGQKLPCHYLQVFRIGIIEMVDAYLLRDYKIFSLDLEGKLLQALPRYVSVQRKLGFDVPIFLMLSLLGVKGFTVVSRQMISMDDIYPIDRENLVIPEGMLNEFDSDWEKIMKPIFDAIWNAAGWPHSMNHDKNGQRRM